MSKGRTGAPCGCPFVAYHRCALRISLGKELPTDTHKGHPYKSIGKIKHSRYLRGYIFEYDVVIHHALSQFIFLNSCPAPQVSE